MSDWNVIFDGSIWLFKPENDTAAEYGREHFPEDCPRLGNAYAVEHRYGEAIAADLLGQGFVLS